MAELTPFSYRHGQTAVHLLDIRSKILLLITFNLVSLKVAPVGMLLLAIAVFALFRTLRIPFLKTLFQVKLFLLLLAFVFLSRALFSEGEQLIRFARLNFSREGLLSGLMFCARLSVILFAGIIFVTTSSTLQIKAGIEWFLRPIPFIPEKRISIMIGLMIRFIPLIFEKSAEISNAQKARAVENIKNPIRRLTLFSIPLLIRTFQTADQLVIAMESRCFEENRTDPELCLQSRDISITFVVGLYLLICWKGWDWLIGTQILAGY